MKKTISQTNPENNERRQQNRKGTFRDTIDLKDI
jgi:hypothetical protein